MNPTTENAFLPTDYKAPPSNSRYMKFIDGENNFRILSSPVVGWSYWDKTLDGNTNIRLPYTQEAYKKAVEFASRNPKQEDRDVKHFWAMAVWNYANDRVEILEITQKGIQVTLTELSKKKGWGNPVKTYDISIDKSGTGLKTEYAVTAIPPEKLSDAILKEIDSTYINLDALFVLDGDPFKIVKSEDEINSEIDSSLDDIFPPK